MSLRITGVASIASAIVATSTSWLVLTDPVTLAAACAEGTVTPLVRAIAAVMLDACRTLVQYL